MFVEGKYWLTCPDKDGFVQPADMLTTDKMREHMIALHGTCELPAVIYKGNLIPPRKF